MILSPVSFKIKQCRRNTTEDAQHDIVTAQYLIEVEASRQQTLETYSSCLTLLNEVLTAHPQSSPADAIARMVTMGVAQTPASSSVCREALMLAQAKREILHSGEWVTAAEISAIALFNPIDSSKPSMWKKMARYLRYGTRMLITSRCTD